MAKLYVICGHGAGDCGACGNGFQEAVQVRKLGKRIKALGGNDVTLGSVSRNFYKDKGITRLKISKDFKLIELHMDCSTSKTAKGAHVIIKEGYKPDKYDEALAEFLCGMFPGRSNKIVGRDNLANVNRAAARGYNYRLVECGFISNPDDAKRFEDSIDDIAKGILKSFGIQTEHKTQDKVEEKPQEEVKPEKPSEQRPVINEYYPKFDSDSIIDGLNSIGVNSGFANRKKIAFSNGIKAYSGLGKQNERLLELARRGKLRKVSAGPEVKPKKEVAYFPRFYSVSITEGLKSIGVDNSFANRKKIAKANGMLAYFGTMSQNVKLVRLAQQGKLKKP